MDSNTVKKIRQALHSGPARYGRAALAAEIGVKPITVKKWELGGAIPTWQVKHLRNIERRLEDELQDQEK